MIKTCARCGRITGYRDCPYCGHRATVQVANRPEDRTTPPRAPAVAIPVAPAGRARLVRMVPVYRRGKPPAFKRAA